MPPPETKTFTTQQVNMQNKIKQGEKSDQVRSNRTNRETQTNCVQQCLQTITDKELLGANSGKAGE